MQACGYLIGHAVLSCVVILILPPLLYRSFVGHTVFLCVLVTSAAWRGASYYEYSFG
eukprot:COSAG01_NODE_38311_length_491_cov_1.051020_1_plen_56_part_01